MKKLRLSRSIRSLSFIFAIFLVVGCGSSRPPVPPGVVPDARDISAEEEQYGQEVLGGLLEQFELDRDDNNINRVRQIVDQLTVIPNGKDKPWHVYVLKDDNFKNAAATRGNYIFIWTGMIRTVKSDDELAVILAHEIGHILAGHPEPDPQEMVNEMISGVAGAVTQGVILHQGVVGDAAALAGKLVASAVQAAIVLPAKQRLELEADHIGLFILARAGIDPRVAVNFWDRIRNDPDFGGGGLAFLSTHPSSEERVRELQQHLPEAIRQYEEAQSINSPARREVPRSRISPPPKEPMPAASAPSVWRVDTHGAEVKKSPRSDSSAVKELQKGDRVTVEEVVGPWIKISSPVKGYVRGRFVVPE